jgi:hypothetical protein
MPEMRPAVSSGNFSGQSSWPGAQPYTMLTASGLTRTQERSSVRKIIVAFMSAFVLAAALIGTASVAYAAPGSLSASSTTCTCSTCAAGPHDFGADNNGHPLNAFQTSYQNNENLAFNSAGAIQYCFYKKSNGYDLVYVVGTGECLALNASTGLVDEDGNSACISNSGLGETWDRWKVTPIPGNGTWFEYQNAYSSGQYCMYFDSQDLTGDLAIWTSCDSADHYEWFSDPIG